MDNRYPPPSTFGVKDLVVTIVVVYVVYVVYSMLRYNCTNSQAERELMELANSVDDITKQLNVTRKSYQLLEDNIATCSQELPKLKKKMATFKTLSKEMEAKKIGWDPKIQPRFPNIDIKFTDSKKPCVKITIKDKTKAKNFFNLFSEFKKDKSCNETNNDVKT